MAIQRSILVPLAMLAGGAAFTARNSSDAGRGSFVTTLGRDTVVIESFTRTATRLEGDIVVRVPGTVLLHYAVDLARDGTPTHSDVQITPMGTKEVTARHVKIDFTHDPPVVDFDSAGHNRRGVIASTGPAFPQLMTGFRAYFGLYASPVLYELYAPVANARVGDTLQLATIDVASGRVTRRVFIKRAANEFDADFFGIAWTRFMLDSSGAVVSADASGTTEKTQMQRAAFVDVPAAAARFAEADRAGKGVGAASPSQIVRGSVDGKLVVVTFSSPRKRNREILGGVVPYGEVWRTGANEASTLVSDADLEIGNTRIPAGAYSLWTLPKRDGSVDLIINSQHGQWGTDYDASHDIAHIPMKVTAVESPQEDFGIAITGSRPTELRMSWDTFVWSVPITAAK